MLTQEQLRSIMPQCPADKLGLYARLLTAAMLEGQIVTVVRAAAFLAELAEESGQLRYFEELATGALYEGRHDLGNDQPGDGRLFKGRGPIQLTGRKNYRVAGAALSLDLENHPEFAATPEVGFRVAVWYWTSRKLNELADQTDFRGITKAINGGYNGLEQRVAFYHRALEILGRDVVCISAVQASAGCELKG